MSEWAHPFAIGVGLVYTVAGLAKFYGLKDFYVSKQAYFIRMLFPLDESHNAEAFTCYVCSPVVLWLCSSELDLSS